MKELYSVAEILEATGGRAHGLEAETVSGISIDSREIAPDDLFVAIKGDRFDGHQFVAGALKGGAAAALVSEGYAEGQGLIAVPDAFAGLRDLARFRRAQMAGLVVAVTGSVGKTTTKEALRRVLSVAGEIHASVKSFNNHWGVPLTLARMTRTAQFGIFEIGMNAPGEITPLVQMVRPHVAVITAIAPAHLELLGSLEAIAHAKAEIFDGLEPGGKAVINADHGQLDILLAKAEARGVEIVTFGFAEGADWRIISVETAGEQSFARVEHAGERFELVIAAHGRHMVSNALAALIVAEGAGVDRRLALDALGGFGAQAGRGARSLVGPEGRQILLIDESYNANPASMKAALDVFASQAAPGGKKIVVLGDMLELGKDAPALHAGLKDAVLAAGATEVFLVGPAMAALAEALGSERVTAYAPSAVEIEQTLLGALAPGDALMVKGSNGVRLTALVDYIRKSFA